jgi:hypothetical protein
MTTIYILKLEHDCYYVGKTNNYSKRINNHLNNSGALWTQLHKVIGEEKIIPNCSSFDEDRYVKEYMAKYGIDKVRGGSYVTKELSNEQYNLLTKEIWAATDACTRCGRKNHFIKDCYAKIDINNYIIDEEDDDEDDEEDDEEDNEDEKDDKEKDDKYKLIITYNDNITFGLLMDNFDNFINSIRNTNKYYHNICVKKKIHIIDFDNEYAKNIDKLYGEFLKYYILFNKEDSYITPNIHNKTLLIWLNNPQTLTGDELFNNISDKDKDFVSTIKHIHLSRSRFSRLLDIFAKVRYKYIEIGNNIWHIIRSLRIWQSDIINNPNYIDEYLKSQSHQKKAYEKLRIQIEYISHARYIIKSVKKFEKPVGYYGGEREEDAYYCLECSREDYFSIFKIDDCDFLDYIVDINSIKMVLKPNYENTKYYISKQKHLDSLNYLTSYCNEYSCEFEEILTNIPNICIANLKNKKNIYQESNLKDLD